MSAIFHWLAEPPLADLLDRLDGDGEEARVVGGAVRNALLGEPVAEWDIATTAPPGEVARRAGAAGWKVVPTGIDHGTLTVVVAGQPFEVTTLRQDIETNGRHAVVRFGRDFAADALRRDFTINALSVGRDGTIHDYAGGLADIAARRVRFIGDPDRRIAEDYLRILRLFRFQARYGSGAIDAAGLEACIRARAGLAKLSRERIRTEMLKLMAAPRAASVLVEIEAAGFPQVVLAGISRPPVLRRLIDLEGRRGLAADPLLRLGAAFLFVREDAERIAPRLRLSRAEAARLAAMAAAAETLSSAPTPHGARALLYRLGRAGFHDAVLLAFARASSGETGFAETLDLAGRWPIPARPFTGRQLERFGLAAGPQVGRILAEAERRWIDADFPSDPASHDAILRAALAGEAATR